MWAPCLFIFNENYCEILYTIKLYSREAEGGKRITTRGKCGRGEERGRR